LYRTWLTQYFQFLAEISHKHLTSSISTQTLLLGERNRAAVPHCAMNSSYLFAGLSVVRIGLSQMRYRDPVENETC
jgi:hypothetical protein